MGNSWAGAHSDVAVSQTFEPSDDELKRYCEALRLFSGLPSTIKQQLRIPMRRLNQAKRRQSLEDKALDLGVALESLFLHDNPSPEQISLAFRLRGAWMLGKGADDRTQIYAKLKEIYKCRSKAIHSGRVPFKVKVNKVSKPTDELLVEGMELCAEAILATIQNKSFPDFIPNRKPRK